MSIMKMNDDDLELVTGGVNVGTAYIEKRYCEICNEKTDHKIMSGDRAYCMVCNGQSAGVSGGTMPGNAPRCI